jgi:hypothetical protein
MPEVNFAFWASLLKNPFAPSSAPGAEAKYGAFVVFSPRFRALLDRRLGRGPLFQQAGAFCEVRIDGVLRSSDASLVLLSTYCAGAHTLP